MNSRSSTITFQSGPEQTALLELYTSEGCSSCPPAEKWLSGLKNSPGLWKDFVPVAFHVDYWDHLGWRDPFADPEFSDRQFGYAKNWHSENVYTPAFVLNGKEWSGWMLQKGGPKKSNAKTGTLTVSSSETDRWQVTFEPAPGREGSFEIHTVLLVNDVSSDVKAGENRGRHLNHDFAVKDFITVPLKHSGDVYQGRFVLRQSTGEATNNAIAVWITPKDSLEVVQATGGWIVPSSAGSEIQKIPAK
ncbi:MAG TPA: DUF1223 domain-containing protein [Verrucomicrobiae bacterium]|nr:DUF1223 domain-containing protein [Verrucomicrobiae bacterium]